MDGIASNDDDGEEVDVQDQEEEERTPPPDQPRVVNFTPQDLVTVAEALVDKTRNAKRAQSLNALCNKWCEETSVPGSLCEELCELMEEYLADGFQDRASHPCEKEVKLLYQLKIPIRVDFITRLSERAIVQINERKQITFYKDEDNKFGEQLILNNFESHRIFIGLETEAIRLFLKYDTNKKKSLGTLAADFNLWTCRSVDQNDLMERFEEIRGQFARRGRPPKPVRPVRGAWHHSHFRPSGIPRNFFDPVRVQEKEFYLKYLARMNPSSSPRNVLAVLPEDESSHSDDNLPEEEDETSAANVSDDDDSHSAERHLAKRNETSSADFSDDNGSNRSVDRPPEEGNEISNANVSDDDDDSNHSADGAQEENNETFNTNVDDDDINHSAERALEEENESFNTNVFDDDANNHSAERLPKRKETLMTNVSDDDVSNHSVDGPPKKRNKTSDGVPRMNCMHPVVVDVDADDDGSNHSNDGSSELSEEPSSFDAPIRNDNHLNDEPLTHPVVRNLRKIELRSILELYSANFFNIHNGDALMAIINSYKENKMFYNKEVSINTAFTSLLKCYRGIQKHSEVIDTLFNHDDSAIVNVLLLNALRFIGCSIKNEYNQGQDFKGIVHKITNGLNTNSLENWRVSLEDMKGVITATLTILVDQSDESGAALTSKHDRFAQEAVPTLRENVENSGSS